MRSRAGGAPRELLYDATDGLFKTSVQLQSRSARTPPKTGEYQRPESKTIQQLTEPSEICTTSTPGSNPGGASNFLRKSNGPRLALAASRSDSSRLQRIQLGVG